MLKTFAKIVLLLTSVLISFHLLGQDSSQKSERLSSYEIWSVEKSNLDKIAEKFEITRRFKQRGADHFEVIVPQDEASTFLKLAPKALLLEKDISQSARLMRLPRAEGQNYRSLSQVQSQLSKWATDYPDFAKIIEYGRTAKGHPLLALKVSDNVQIDENEPELMLTAATHGDELITTEILLNLIHEFLTNPEQSSRLSEIIANTQIFFIPVVNPDGFVATQRYENFKDPNRSYPYPDQPNVKPTPSIDALIRFFHQQSILGSIDFHAYGEMIMYPWAYTTNPIEESDASALDYLTKAMAETNGYVQGPISKVIYVAKGSSADYYHWKNKTKAIAVEVGQAKVPDPSKIGDYTTAQRESTLIFLESFITN